MRELITDLLITFQFERDVVSIRHFANRPGGRWSLADLPNRRVNLSERPIRWPPSRHSNVVFLRDLSSITHR
jgi:hypothetical protein